MDFQDFLQPDVEPKMSTGVFLPPPGKNKATIIKVEDGFTNANDGRRLTVFFIVDGFGKDIRHWFIYEHDNDRWKANDGQAELRKLTEAVGLAWPFTDPQQLSGRQLLLDLVHEDSKNLKDDGTPFVNAKVKDFLPLSALKGIAPEKPTSVPPAPTEADAPTDWPTL